MMKGFILINENETHQFLYPFHDPKYDFFSYFSHEKASFFDSFIPWGKNVAVFASCMTG